MMWLAAFGGYFHIQWIRDLIPPMYRYAAAGMEDGRQWLVVDEGTLSRAIQDAYRAELLDEIREPDRPCPCWDDKMELQEMARDI